MENAAPSGSFGLKDSVCHLDSHRVVAKSEEGVVIKVLLATPGLTLTGDDGLQLTANTTLLVAYNS
jgi:hypothetical protein